MSVEFSDVSSSAQNSALIVWHSINICRRNEQMRQWLISDGLWAPWTTESCPWCCPGPASSCPSCSSVLTLICLVILSYSPHLYLLPQLLIQTVRGQKRKMQDIKWRVWDPMNSVPKDPQDQVQTPWHLLKGSSLLLQPIVYCFLLVPALPVSFCSLNCVLLCSLTTCGSRFHVVPTPPDLVCPTLSQPSDFIAKTTFSWRPCLIPR